MTTGVESWAKVSELGPVYPFVGSELLLFIVCVALWLGWHVWQLRNEARELSIEKEELKDKARTARILDQ